MASGVKELMVGGLRNLKPAKLVVPARLLTETLPVEPLATTALMVLSPTIVKEEACVPPNETPVAPVKKFPLMVTSVPETADVGKNVLIWGGAT